MTDSDIQNSRARRMGLGLITSGITEIFNKLSPLAILYVAKMRLGASSFGLAQNSMVIMEALLAFVAFGYSGIASLEIGAKRRDKKFIAEITMDVLSLKFLHLAGIGLLTCAYLFSGHSTDEAATLAASSLLLLASALDTDFLHHGARTMIARNLITIAAKLCAVAGVFLLVTGPEDAAIYAVMASIPPLLISIFSAFYHLRIYSSSQATKADLQRMTSLLKSAFPFGVVGVLFTLFDRFDILLAGSLFTDAMVGQYAAQMRLVQAISTTAASIGIIFYSELVTEPRPDVYARLVERSLWAMTALVAPITIGAWFLKHDIVSLMYGPDTAEHSDIFFLLMVGSLLMVAIQVFGNQVLLIKRKLWSYNVIATIALLSGLLFALTVVPHQGLEGIALSNIVAKLLCGGAFVYYGRQYVLKINFRPTLLLVLPCAVMTMTLTQMNHLNLSQKIFSGGLVYLVSLGLVFRQQLDELWRKVNGR